MKRSLFWTALLGLSILTTSHCSARSRRGVVWQFGASISPVRQLSIHDVSSDKNTSGPGRSILVGYGFTEKDVIFLEFDHTTKRSDLLGNSRVFYNVTAITAQRYLSESLKQLYLTAGIGVLDFYVVDDDYDSAGPAFLFGGGYEFVKHVDAAVRYTYGRTKYFGQNVSHRFLSLVISAKIY